MYSFTGVLGHPRLARTHVPDLVPEEGEGLLAALERSGRRSHTAFVESRRMFISKDVRLDEHMRRCFVFFPVLFFGSWVVFRILFETHVQTFSLQFSSINVHSMPRQTNRLCMLSSPGIGDLLLVESLSR